MKNELIDMEYALYHCLKTKFGSEAVTLQLNETRSCMDIATEHNTKIEPCKGEVVNIYRGTLDNHAVAAYECGGQEYECGGGCNPQKSCPIPAIARDDDVKNNLVDENYTKILNKRIFFS